MLTFRGAQSSDFCGESGDRRTNQEQVLQNPHNPTVPHRWACRPPWVRIQQACLFVCLCWPAGRRAGLGSKGSNRLPRLYLRRRLLYVIKESGSLRALSPLSIRKHYVSHAAFDILQQPVGWLVRECALMGAIEKIPSAVGGCGSFRWKGSFVPCGHPKWEFGERQKWPEGMAHVHGD